MDRTAALQAIRNARQTRGITYDDLAKAIGTQHADIRVGADEHAKVALERV